MMALNHKTKTILMDILIDLILILICFTTTTKLTSNPYIQLFYLNIFLFLFIFNVAYSNVTEIPFLKDMVYSKWESYEDKRNIANEILDGKKASIGADFLEEVIGYLSSHLITLPELGLITLYNVLSGFSLFMASSDANLSKENIIVFIYIAISYILFFVFDLYRKNKYVSRMVSYYFVDLISSCL